MEAISWTFNEERLLDVLDNTLLTVAGALVISLPAVYRRKTKCRKSWDKSLKHRGKIGKQTPVIPTDRNVRSQRRDAAMKYPFSGFPIWKKLFLFWGLSDCAYEYAFEIDWSIIYLRESELSSRSGAGSLFPVSSFSIIYWSAVGLFPCQKLFDL